MEKERTAAAPMGHYIEYPDVETFIQNHRQCYENAFGVAGAGPFGIPTNLAKTPSLLHYITHGVPLRKNSKGLRREGAFGTASGGQDLQVNVPNRHTAQADVMGLLVPMLTGLTRFFGTLPPEAACPQLATPRALTRLSARPLQAEVEPQVAKVEPASQVLLALPDAASPVAAATVSDAPAAVKAEPATAEAAHAAPSADGVAAMEHEMRCAEKRKAATQNIEDLKKHRPKMPSDTGKAVYGEAYVKKHGKENKWRIVFSTSSPGGTFERTRQWKDAKTKKAQFISALEAIEARMIEVAANEGE